MAFHFDRNCRLLGPFIGHTTETEARIWLHVADLKPGERRTLHLTLHPGRPNARAVQRLPLVVSEEDCGVGVVSARHIGQLVLPALSQVSMHSAWK